MRYAVDPSSLHRRATALEQVRAELAASRLLGQVDPLVLGTPEVVAAVRAACDDWSIARGRLEAELAHLAGAAGRAAQTYADVDDGVAAALTPGSTPGGTS